MLCGLRSIFLQVLSVWSVNLHRKHVIQPSVKNILNSAWLWCKGSDPRSFGESSCFINSFRRKLEMWSYLSMLIPALRWTIWDTGVILIFLSASRMIWFGIGQTLNMTILLDGLMSRRISINCSLIVIVWVDAKSESSICLLQRKTQNRLFYRRKAKTMFLGEISLPMTTI